MLQTFKNGQGSIVLRVKLLDSSVTTGAGLTGLTSASSGLIISTIADKEATATTYTVAGSTIETITTLGTYAAPTATKVRFKEVDSTNHKGVYEIQIADARFAVSGAKSLLVSILGATNLAQSDFVIQLQSDDPYVAKPPSFATFGQEIAKIVYPWKDVVFVRSDGSDANDGTCPTSAKLTLAGGKAVAVSGDVLLVGAGTFTIATAGLRSMAGISILGASIDATIFTGDSELNTNGCQINPGTASTLQRFTIKSVPTASNKFGAPIGCNNSVGDAAFTDVYLKDVRMIGDSDGLYADNLAAIELTGGGEIYIETKFDAVAQFQNTSERGLVLREPFIRVQGPSLTTAWGGLCRGCTNDDGGIHLIRPAITVGGGTSINAGLYMDSSDGQDGTTTVYGGSLRVGGPAGLIHSIHGDGAQSHIVNLSGVSYDQSTEFLTGSNTVINSSPISANTRQIAGVVAPATNLGSYHTNVRHILGTVAASPAPTTTTFKITTTISLATKSPDNMYLTLTRTSGGDVERRRVASITNIDATSATIVLASALSSAPASTDKVKIE